MPHEAQHRDEARAAEAEDEVTDPTAHWSPSEVDDDGARASYPPPPTLDLDAIEARYAIAACEVGDSDAWRSAIDVPDLVARVRELEAQLSATEAEARVALDALHARCDAAEGDAAAAETLAARLGDLLRATADALKGPPPPLGLHSTHDLPEVAAEMRRRDELSSAIVGLNESIKEQHIERARDLARFRGQACYVANVARRLLPSLETHGADGWPLDRVAADALAAEVERLRAEVADAQPVLLLDAIRRGPPSDDIAFPDSERRPVTVSHVEHRTAPPFAIEVDRDHCPTCGALDLDHSPEECARRWAAEHPYAAGAMHGGIAHRSEVSK